VAIPNPSAHAACEQREQSELRANEGQEQRNELRRWWGAKSLLNQYGDKKKRPRNEDNDRRSDD